MALYRFHRFQYLYLLDADDLPDVAFLGDTALHRNIQIGTILFSACNKTLSG
jgi:hypothetical protein